MLDKYRQEINQIDREIIQLLERRFSITKAVGEYKKENNIPILNRDREQEIIRKIEKLQLENEPYVIEIYLQLMAISKEQQNG